MATKADFYSTYVASINAPSSLEDVATLTFTPTSHSKFIFLAQGDVTFTSGSTIQSLCAQIILEVDGTTYCDVINEQGYFSFFAFEELTLNVSHTVKVKALRYDATSQIKYMNLVAFGVDKWETMQQGNDDTTVLTSNTNRSSKILLQQQFYPDISNCLVFAYAEQSSESTQSSGDNIFGEFSIYFDNDSDSSLSILKMSVGNFNYIDDSASNWGSIFGMRRFNLGTSRRSLIFKTNKQDNEDKVLQYRRLRAAIIPLDRLPFVSTVQDFEHTTAPNIPVVSGGITTSYFSFPSGVTTLLIGSRVTGRQLGSVSNDISTISYNDSSGYEFLSRALLSGHAFDFLSPTESISGKSQLIMKVYRPNSLITDGRIHYGSLNGTSSHVSTHTLQFQQDTTDTTFVVNNDVKDNYDVRTLVEIYKPKEIMRFSLQEDTFLLAGLTTSQIITAYNNGDIDRSSFSDLTVTGRQAIEALDRGDTDDATDLLNLTTGLPDGVTVTPVSEFMSFSNIHKLYKKSILTSLKVSEKSSNSFSGVVSTNTVKATLIDTGSDFNTEDKRRSFLGSILKVRYYDKYNNELRSVFSGRITDVDIADQVKITAINPNVDIMNIELPRTSVSDITLVGITQLADDPEASIPFFTGYARRLITPNVNKFYGTQDGVTPDFVDAYSDYAVGGFLVNSKYPHTILRKDRANNGVYRAWVGITASIEFNDPYTVVENDIYKIKDNHLPTVRFVSTAITTSTRSSVLSMPHGVTNGTDDLSAEYATLTPSTGIRYVQGYLHGQDWFQPSATPNIVNWSPAGGEPVVSGTSTTTSIVTRGTPAALDASGMSDNINSESGLETHKNITTVSGISYSGVSPTVTFTEGTHYNLSSSNSLRTFEDVIDWSPVAATVSEWNFNGDVLDAITTTGNDLTGTGGQPTYDDAGAALQFLDSATDGYSKGSVRITDGSQTNLDINDTTDLRLTAYVQQNTAGNLQGNVINKRAVALEGYELGIVSENVEIGGGDPTKFIAKASIKPLGVGPVHAVAGTTVTATKLNDGNIHKLELVKDEVNAELRLLVDGAVEATTSTGIAAAGLENSADFVVGGTSFSFSQFLGKIHKVSIATDATTPPSPGITYSVSYTFKPDRYQVEWDYDVVTVSDPIQSSVIGVDAVVAGSTVTPITLKGTAPLTGLTQAFWVRGPGQSGYALRLNQANASSDWHLGQSGLGVTTYLGSSTDGRVNFSNNDSIMKVKGDFSLYGCGTWRGGPGQSGLIVAKETSNSAKPSYALGVNGGTVYGMICADGTKYELNAVVKADTKDVVNLMLSRSGLTMNLYFNGKNVSSKVVSQHTDADYDSGDLVIGSDAILGERWSGDVSFVGLADFAHDDFAKYQTELMSSHVKGGWSEFIHDTSTAKTGRTLFHIPFTEGVGITVSSRNLHRNFGQTIKRILTDPILGLNEEVDSLSFDTAITVLDDLGLKCDFRLFQPRKVVQILEELLMVRGMRIRKSVSGIWEIIVDSKKTESKIKFGSGDGFYENILKISSVDYRSTDQSIKELKLEFMEFADASGEVKFHNSITRMVLPYGVETKVYQFPSIYDSQTADMVADYLSKKIKYSIKSLSITVGMEGRSLVIGDLVTLDVPRLNINDEIFTITSTAYSESTVILKLEGYSTHTYDYDPGPIPKSPRITGEL